MSTTEAFLDVNQESRTERTTSTETREIENSPSSPEQRSQNEGNANTNTANTDTLASAPPAPASQAAAAAQAVPAAPAAPAASQAVVETHESSDEDDYEFEPDDKIDQFELWSSDATSPEEDSDKDESSKKKYSHNWKDTISRENIRSLEFTGFAGITGLDSEKKYSPLECFKLFVDDNLIDLMVTETNKHARASFIRYGYHKGFLSGWLDVDSKEMTQFVGLLLFMALKRLPGITAYWSTERIYFNSVACRVFTQTRFHRILKFWHFGDDGTDHVHSKVNPLVTKLNENFMKYNRPGHILYVCKSTVCFGDRIPVSHNKRGSKVLKVMDQDIYTYKIQIITPESSATRMNLTKINVLNLLDGFMDEGRLVIFHNLYIYFDLVQELLKRKCHSIGIIRKNARGTPKELISRSVQEGELIGCQNSDGISVMKWQVLDAPYFGLTTCHTLETVPVQKKKNSGLYEKETVEDQIPAYLRDISLSEKVFDAHDKFSTYSAPLKAKLKWYQRIACDAMINTALTNALVMYKKLNKEKIKMWDFRDKLFRELVDVKQLPSLSSDDETEEPDLDE